LHLIKEVVPGMIARNSGHIINIGSIAGHEAYKNGRYTFISIEDVLCSEYDE